MTRVEIQAIIDKDGYLFYDIAAGLVFKPNMISKTSRVVYGTTYAVYGIHQSDFWECKDIEWREATPAEVEKYTKEAAQ